MNNIRIDITVTQDCNKEASNEGNFIYPELKFHPMENDKHGYRTKQFTPHHNLSHEDSKPYASLTKKRMDDKNTTLVTKLIYNSEIVNINR